VKSRNPGRAARPGFRLSSHPPLHGMRATVSSGSKHPSPPLRSRAPPKYMWGTAVSEASRERQLIRTSHISEIALSLECNLFDIRYAPTRHFSHGSITDA
jgi:hypothetical protein